MMRWRNGSAGYFGISDQVKIDENRLIQTTRVLNVEVEKLEDLRKTAENLFSMVFETYLYVAPTI
jgi:hypothetical protein